MMTTMVRVIMTTTMMTTMSADDDEYIIEDDDNQQPIVKRITDSSRTDGRQQGIRIAYFRSGRFRSAYVAVIS